MEQLNQLFVEAGTLLFAGMAFVFAFLSLLIVFINAVLKKLALKFPDPIPQSKPQRVANKKNTPAGGLSPNIVAAISSAVSKYRQQHKLDS
jgi:oxaloacetate decarboxylase gamma subunit